MPPSDLRETTMNKKSRSLIKVLKNAGKASEAVSQLMGKNAESRFFFINKKQSLQKTLIFKPPFLF
ncbi:MAG: hypothetical protein Ct9H300mP23_07280 [Nitrospinota bacterium]|nr:MAG: hypothetical protein Ct9H300mP23_07280 [Nitrospinota bacterium]